MKLIPQIRFKGFTDDWEERKLLDNVDKVLDYRGKSPTKFGMEWGTEGYLVLSALNVKNGYIDKSVEAKYGDQELFERWMGSNRLEKGDVLFTTEAPLGNVAQVPDDNGYILNQRAVAFKSSKDTDNNFFAQLLRSPIVQNTLNANSSGGTAKGIGMKEFAKLNAHVPKTFEEQQKIGTFFKQLDHTIALHQRKLDLVKETKKGFLQKMFPKNGEKVPEIRFPGFTEDWEQRKVFEISKVTYGGGTPKTNTKEFWNGNIPWIQSSDLEINRLFNVSPKKKITNEAVKKSAAKIIPPNSIAIVTRVGVGKLALMPFEYATSQDFLSLSELQIDSYFGIFSLYSMLQKELKNIQGTSIKGMTKSDLLEKKVTIPKKCEEQQKIGIFFKQLDDTITLHQSKLDLLKETKKGFLQKMF